MICIRIPTHLGTGSGDMGDYYTIYRLMYHCIAHVHGHGTVHGTIIGIQLLVP
jgi:hypothetical protein